jgi:ABC-2 type transport system permease protein
MSDPVAARLPEGGHGDGQRRDSANAGGPAHRMTFLADTRHHFVRLLRATARMPVFIAMSVFQPILWVLLFGALFGSVARLPGFEATSYVQFLAPGVAVMTALFGSAHAGLGLLTDMDRGVLERILVTPASRPALLAGRILNSAFQVAIQSLLILGVSFLRGARPHGGLAGLGAVVAATAILGAAFSALSNALALAAKRQEVVLAVMNFVILPLVYMSTMLMAPGLMPSWMAATARFNPVDWAVSAARAGFEGQGATLVAAPLGLLALFAVASGGVARWSFRRYEAQL